MATKRKSSSEKSESSESSARTSKSKRRAPASRRKKTTRTRKTTARSTRAKRGRSSGDKKYDEKASNKVGRVMHEMKRGKLRSGRSGKKVTSRKQAIAIGLSEARRSGAKVPSPKRRKKSA
jgi:hypothetical protein